MTPWFFWWNPIIHFPLSGPVTQDIDVLLRELRAKNKQLDRHLETATNVIVAGAKPLAPGETQHMLLGHVMLTDMPAPIVLNEDLSQEKRIELTKKLLGVLRSLDNEEFGHVVRSVAEE